MEDKTTQSKTQSLTLSDMPVPTAILLGSVVIAIAILVSGGVIKVKGKNEQVLSASSSAQVQPANNQAQDRIVTASVDDDPILGKKEAPVTIVEFSDYECPYCKRHFDQTHAALKSDYIDTGKVKLVYRDLPLNFHQNANIEAQAADCARDQKGDEAYFKYHDEIFKRTTSNGTGIAVSTLPVIAKDLGLDVDPFQKCLDGAKFKDEVAKDYNDATAAGVDSTPSFLVGRSSADGNVTGVLIEGAKSFSSFKSVIDALLKS